MDWQASQVLACVPVVEPVFKFGRLLETTTGTGFEGEYREAGTGGAEEGCR